MAATRFIERSDDMRDTKTPWTVGELTRAVRELQQQVEVLHARLDIDTKRLADELEKNAAKANEVR